MKKSHFYSFWSLSMSYISFRIVKLFDKFMHLNTFEADVS